MAVIDILKANFAIRKSFPAILRKIFNKNILYC